MHTDKYCDTSGVVLLYLEKELSLWETDSIQGGRLAISAVGGDGLNRPLLERRCRIKKKITHRSKTLNKPGRFHVFTAEVEKICVAEFRHFKPKTVSKSHFQTDITVQLPLLITDMKTIIFHYKFLSILCLNVQMMKINSDLFLSHYKPEI